jgi:hypothetical protein
MNLFVKHLLIFLIVLLYPKLYFVYGKLHT